MGAWEGPWEREGALGENQKSENRGLCQGGFAPHNTGALLTQGARTAGGGGARGPPDSSVNPVLVQYSFGNTKPQLSPLSPKVPRLPALRG